MAHKRNCKPGGGAREGNAFILTIQRLQCPVTVCPAQLTAAFAVPDHHLDGEGRGGASAECAEDVVTNLLLQVAIATQQAGDLAELVGRSVVS